MQNPKRILLTGGGTAGHVNPALAIGKALDHGEVKFLYVGVHGKVEEEVVPREGIPIKYVLASGFPSRPSALSLLFFLIRLKLGILQSLFILLRFRPDIIVGTGGFASAPMIIASFLLRKLRLSAAEVYLHEQNAIPGKLNRLMGGFADLTFVTFPETLMYFRKNGILAGYPLRRRIATVPGDEARQQIDFPIPPNRKVILIFGGSQGSRAINRGVIDSLRYLMPHREHLFMVHGMGLFKSPAYHAVRDTEARFQSCYTESERQLIQQFYIARPFFHNIECLYSMADLAVVRGGAGSLNEVSAMGLPAIVIPKPNLPGDHQVMNARAMQKSGGAEILYEGYQVIDGRIIEHLDGAKLAERIIALVNNDDQLKKMRERSQSFLNHNAADTIQRRILSSEENRDHSASSCAAPADDATLPGNQALLSLLERSQIQAKERYSPAAVIPNPGDLLYLRNRASSLLLSSAWQERNLGIKLLGLLGSSESVPLLLALFNDRRPAPFYKRLLGGDFEQVGFIRRNILTAFVRLGQVTPAIESAILLSFTDPYYEVRAEGARASAKLGQRLAQSQKIVTALIKQLTDRNVEAATAAAEALGLLGGESDALPALLSMKHFRFWKMRSAALKGIFSLVSRGKVYDLRALAGELPGFILTSTDFEPQFEIKSIYRKLMEAATKAKADQS